MPPPLGDFLVLQLTKGNCCNHYSPLPPPLRPPYTAPDDPRLAPNMHGPNFSTFLQELHLLPEIEPFKPF